ncbi:MAG TPA: SDR family oxidoreductase [Candidatus Sulfotelmatobacter sp.]|nr:SDR family oxidoreductase [Candidatus Sulfotelmatobacter sp.]
MKILGTGLTGLVGSRFVELFESAYEFTHINLQGGIDILDKKSVLDVISSSDAKFVIHMAAKTNVDGCELDKEKDKKAFESNNFEEIINDKTAWAVNVLGTKNIVEACAENKKKLIYISTDFVFNGQKKSYSEEDKPEPINWYAKTKYEGEKLIQSSGIDFAIIRLAYPYRAYFGKNDFVRAILSRLKENQDLNVITDHIMTPTFVDDFASALNILIQTDVSGIFHVVGSQSLTPYECAIKIAKEFDLDESLIKKTTRKKYFKDKAPRPFCLSLKNDKIGKLGIEMSTFNKGIIEVKNQLERISL